MTPVLDPPKRATRSTQSAAVDLEVSTLDLTDDLAPEADETSWLDSHNWPEGIDYEKWSKVARPSPRSAFADRLDIVDLLDD